MRSIIVLLVVLCSTPVYSQAVWNGRQYNNTICSSPNCRMCASIRSQLSTQQTVVQQVVTQQVVTQQVVKQSTGYATITIETLPGCDPCNRWKSHEAQELRAAGWTIIEAPLTSSQSAPYFRICVGNKCFSHSGFMTHSILRGILAKITQPTIRLKKQLPLVSNSSSAHPVNMLTNTELVSTPHLVVETMLRILKPTTSEILYDIGCGDGRFIVSAAKDYSCIAVGIELNHESAQLARQRASDAMVSTKVLVFERDAQTLNYLAADIVVMYLYPELMTKIVPKLKPGCRVASYIHEIPGIESIKYTVDNHVFYVGTKQ